MIPLAVPCQKRGDDWVGGINTDSDPFFSNVISLLHFNGSGYSQVVVDEIGNTWGVYTGVESDPSAGIVASQHGIDSAFVTNYNSSNVFKATTNSLVSLHFGAICFNCSSVIILISYSNPPTKHII